MASFFVVLDAAAVANSAPEQIPGLAARVTHRYGPRAVIVETDADTEYRITQHPGVAGVFATTVPAPIVAQLDEAGRLGAAAWNARQDPSHREAKSPRRGEGLAWDHPGFEPEG